MGWEIERKFLVDTGRWRPSARGVRLRQGYLASGLDACVRVRLSDYGAFLTVKGPPADTPRREFEYCIPEADARILLDELCGGRIIDKTRYLELHAGQAWEVDVFHGDNDGLVLAKIELQRPDSTFARPYWATTEVSREPRYDNSELAIRPYKHWTSETVARVPGQALGSPT